METLELYGTKCETYGKRADSYSFTVDDVSKIDLNRIVKEQYEAGNLVTLLTDGKEPKALLIHNEFLDNFTFEDILWVGGDHLCPSWGEKEVNIGYSLQSFHLYYSGNPGYIILENSRFLPLSGDVETVKKQLVAARAFVRKITIKVHTL